MMTESSYFTPQPQLTMSRSLRHVSICLRQQSEISYEEWQTVQMPG